MITKSTYYQLLYICLTCLLLSSCSDEEDTGEAPVRTPVSLKASIYEFEATEGNVWKSGEEFGVFMLEAGTGKVVNNYANLLYTADDYSATGYLIPSGEPMYWPTDGTTVDFVAYHPYRSDAAASRASGWQVSIDLSDQNRVAADDFIYSKDDTGRKASGSFEFQLKPVLARVVVDLMAGAGISTGQLDAMKMSIRGKHTLGVYDLIEGKFLEFSKKGEVDMKKSDDGEHRHEAVIFPGEVADEMKVSVAIPAEEGDTLQLETSLNNTITYAEENTEYEIGLKVTPDGLEPTLVSTSPIYILDWQDDKEDVEEEITTGAANLVKDGKLDKLTADAFSAVTSVPATPHTWYGMANQVEGIFDLYRDRQQGNVLSMKFAGSLSWYKNYIGYTSKGAEAATYQLTFKARADVAGAKLQTYVRINKSGNHFFVLEGADLTKACASQTVELTKEWTTYVVNFDFTRTANTLYASGLEITPAASDDLNNFYVAFAAQQAEVEYSIDDITFIKQE